MNVNDPALSAAKPEAPAGCHCRPTQEIRLAVVMYGGVSLAIYMNGISQEFLKAVRATAPRTSGAVSACSDDELASTEKVYRKIGQILYHGRKPGEPANPAQFKDLPIKTRILIDILAGTSAGGINAVFLAKALANDQDLDQVRNIWLEEGNIDTLLNDGRSVEGRYDSADPKTSLLNSQRLYGKLLEAFDGMDQNARRSKDFRSRLSNEIDLFVTTTDLNGLVVPIQLANVVIEERAHKAHFRFVYGPDRINSPNDFLSTYNAMLAFASRCTSSFPTAFEPMKIESVRPICGGFFFRHPKQTAAFSSGQILQRFCALWRVAAAHQAAIRRRRLSEQQAFQLCHRCHSIPAERSTCVQKTPVLGPFSRA